MGELLPDWLEDFLAKLVLPREPFLAKLEKQALAQHIPIVHPEVAQFLQLLIRVHRPETILEIGTAIGYSTIHIVRAAGKKAQIKTIEIDQDHAYQAWLNFKEAQVEDQIQSIVGDAIDLIPKLQTKFDLIFLDAAKGQYLTLLPHLLQLLNSPGMIIADNVLLNGWVANEKLIPHRRMKTMVKRMNSFLKSVIDHPDLRSAVVPIGDGLAVSLKEVRD